MASIAYTVIAVLPDEATRRAYLAWLEDGHVDAVIAAGAHSATIVAVEDPADPIKVETRYVFSTRETLGDYLRDQAPALREEGLRLFGPKTGVLFRREIGLEI